MTGPPPAPRPAPDQLGPLLDELARSETHAGSPWRGWRIARIGGGANNLLYRATGHGADLAIKFTIRDDRDRAGREYAALLTIQRAGLPLAPAPVLLERDRYPQPVVVQRWLEGAVLAEPPANDGDWKALLDHYVALRGISPATTTRPLREAVLMMTSAAEGRRVVHGQAARIPLSEQPPALRGLLARLEAAPLPTWPPPPRGLCRCDPNITNFIRQPGRLASVDWENAGWGDPAFEIADLMTHPAYAAVPPGRWPWVVARYVELSGDAGAEQRIRTYQALLLVWWVARFARMLYEIPRGIDRRLVAWSSAWQSDFQAKYARYLAAAEAALPTVTG